MAFHVVFDGRLALDSDPVPLLRDGLVLFLGEAFLLEDGIPLILGLGVDVASQVVEDAREAEAELL